MVNHHWPILGTALLLPTAIIFAILGDVDQMCARMSELNKLKDYPNKKTLTEGGWNSKRQFNAMTF